MISAADKIINNYDNNTGKFYTQDMKMKDFSL